MAWLRITFLFVMVAGCLAVGALIGRFSEVLIKLGFDHASGADPFITTIKDFTGLALYFTLVGLLIGI